MNSAVSGQLLRSLPELYAERTLDQFPHHVVNFVSRLIASDLLAYNEVNLRRGQARVVFNVAEWTDSPYLKVFESFMDQHPLICYQKQTGDLSAHKISDFLSRAQFHRTPLYNELYRHLGGEDQFALSLRFAGHIVVALAMNRTRRTFTEADRQLLNQLQPHLMQAYRNAKAATVAQGEIRVLREAAEDLAVGLIVLDRRLHPRFASRRARQLVRKYFPETVRAAVLPAAVSGWVRRTCQWFGQSLPAATADLTVNRADGTLTVRLVRLAGGDEIVLRLEERGVPLSAQPLEALNLTPRQAEVLLWVAQGKRNPEIAVILGTATRTVQKHLESIFAKLGVESRTAAARRALEVFATSRMPPA